MMEGNREGTTENNIYSETAKEGFWYRQWVVSQIVNGKVLLTAERTGRSCQNFSRTPTYAIMNRSILMVVTTDHWAHTR
jgi:hypothetical protein